MHAALTTLVLAISFLPSIVMGSPASTNKLDKRSSLPLYRFTTLYTDNPDRRLFTEENWSATDMTLDACISGCHEKGYNFAGIENSGSVLW